jgi:putative flavoprotein involved in K+ transport
LGHLEALNDGRLIFAPDLEENLAKGDEWFTTFKKSVDEYVTKTAMDVPQENHSDEDIAKPTAVSCPTFELNLTAAGINSIIWASGFRYDFAWVKLPVFDETGAPVHRRGVTAYPGIYFLGLKWLYKMKSAFLSIAGPAEDAAYLAEFIKAGRKER